MPRALISLVSWDTMLGHYYFVELLGARSWDMISFSNGLSHFGCNFISRGSVFAQSVSICMGSIFLPEAA